MGKELIINGEKYVRVDKEKKEFKLYDLVEYCGIEWYIIKIKGDLLTLMSKDIVKCMAYSNNNSNNWYNSNVKEYLYSEFINELCEDELKIMSTNYDEDKYSCDTVRIPTLREVERLPLEIRKADDSYWTMTSSYGVSEGSRDYACEFYVGSSGYLSSYSVDGTYGVRPVVCVSKEA